MFEEEVGWHMGIGLELAVAEETLGGQAVLRSAAPEGPSAQVFFDWLREHARLVRRYEERVLGAACYAREQAWAPRRTAGAKAANPLLHVSVADAAASIEACELGEWVVGHVANAVEERLLRLRYLECLDVETTAELLGCAYGTVANVQRRAFAHVDGSEVLRGIKLWPVPGARRR